MIEILILSIIDAACILIIVLKVLSDRTTELKNIKEYEKKREKKKKKREEERIINKSPFVDEYYSIESIKKIFESDKKNAENLINIIFPPPQLSNDIYLGNIEEISVKFMKKYEKIVNFIKFYPDLNDEGGEIIQKKKEELVNCSKEMKGITQELCVKYMEN